MRTRHGGLLTACLLGGLLLLLATGSAGYLVAGLAVWTAAALWRQPRHDGPSEQRQ